MSPDRTFPGNSQNGHATYFHGPLVLGCLYSPFLSLFLKSARLSTMPSAILVVVASAILGLTESSHQVGLGSACTSSEQCDRYQFCQRYQFLNGGCGQGVCKCLPGLVVGVSGHCESTYIIPLGNVCSQIATEVYPPLASCQAGFVQCNEGFISDGQQCVRRSGFVGFGEKCSVRSQPNCHWPLNCDPVNSRCVCNDQHNFFDSSKQSCVPRQYGDPCSTDSDCDSGAYAVSGYACVNGKCGCQSYFNTIAVMSFNATDSFQHIICQNRRVPQNRLPRSICTLAPERYSSAPDNLLCAPGLACLRCPNDIVDPAVTEYQGRCYDTTRASEFAPWQITTTPSTVSNAGQICRDDFDCGTNAHCEKRFPTALGYLDPPCRLGRCKCLDNYATDSHDYCKPCKYFIFEWLFVTNLIVTHRCHTLFGTTLFRREK